MAKLSDFVDWLNMLSYDLHGTMTYMGLGLQEQVIWLGSTSPHEPSGG
jgi:GH18 family chitinase